MEGTVGRHDRGHNPSSPQACTLTPWSIIAARHRNGNARSQLIAFCPRRVTLLHLRFGRDNERTRVAAYATRVTPWRCWTDVSVASKRSIDWEDSTSCTHAPL